MIDRLPRRGVDIWKEKKGGKGTPWESIREFVRKKTAFIYLYQALMKKGEKEKKRGYKSSNL